MSATDHEQKIRRVLLMKPPAADLAAGLAALDALVAERDAALAEAERAQQDAAAETSE